MPWFLVDDKLHSHRKRYRAGVEAMGLWTIAGSWAADQLTDGFVPEYVVIGWGTKCKAHAARLVTAGLWHPAEVDGEPGWRFHEWSPRNPTRAEVEQKRAEARERMRKNRSRSQDVRANEQANEQRSSDAVTPTPAQPYPAQPLTTNGETSHHVVTDVTREHRNGMMALRAEDAS
jgi:hypothetical protein